MRHDRVDKLLDSLPRHFDFYHLGEVELRSESDSNPSAPADLGFPLSSDRIAVVFGLQGDAAGVFALLLTQGLDVSTYTELGNVIASRMATYLENTLGIEVAISPPRILGPAQLRKLLMTGQAHSRTYLHEHLGRIVPLQALIISEGRGYV